MKQFEYIEHTADLGIKVYGSTIKELFENAAVAFFEIFSEPGMIKPVLKRRIVVEKKGYEQLLVQWLGEFLYLFEVENLLFKECSIESLDENHLEAIVFGEEFDPGRHEIKNIIKAVTYHQLCIREKDGLYQTVIIFDI